MFPLVAYHDVLLSPGENKIMNNYADRKKRIRDEEKECKSITDHLEHLNKEKSENLKRLECKRAKLAFEKEVVKRTEQNMKTGRRLREFQQARCPDIDYEDFEEMTLAILNREFPKGMNYIYGTTVNKHY